MKWIALPVDKPWNSAGHRTICPAENLKIRFCPTRLLICRTFCPVEYFYCHKKYIFQALYSFFQCNMMQETSELWKLPQLRMSFQRVFVALHLKFTCFALFQWMVSWKPSESTVNLCNMWKISEIASARSWNIIFENFVWRTEEVAEQSVRQLKIFISRLAVDVLHKFYKNIDVNI